MKVLFAVSDENISNAIKKDYQVQYKEILSSKNVYYFDAIVNELQRDKTYDRIVISEDLQPLTTNNYEAIDKFIFEKLDDITDEANTSTGEDIPIILICADRRTPGEEFLNKIFGIGIYCALLGEQRSSYEVCNLINKPRNKKEAKFYYRMTSGDVEYRTEADGDVSEAEIQNIINYYRKVSGNQAKYVEAFNKIANQYNNQQLKVIISFMPQEVRRVLEASCAKYQEVIGNQEIPVEEVVDVSGKKVKKTAERKYDLPKGVKNILNNSERGQVNEQGIRVSSINPGNPQNRPVGPVIIPTTLSYNPQSQSQPAKPQPAPQEPVEPQMVQPQPMQVPPQEPVQPQVQQMPMEPVSEPQAMEFDLGPQEPVAEPSIDEMFDFSQPAPQEPHPTEEYIPQNTVEATVDTGIQEPIMESLPGLDDIGTEETEVQEPIVQEPMIQEEPEIVNEVPMAEVPVKEPQTTTMNDAYTMPGTIDPMDYDVDVPMPEEPIEPAEPTYDDMSYMPGVDELYEPDTDVDQNQFDQAQYDQMQADTQNQQMTDQMNFDDYAVPVYEEPQDTSIVLGEPEPEEPEIEPEDTHTEVNSLDDAEALLNKLKNTNKQDDFDVSDIIANLSSDKKIVSFVGSPQNGTSFLVNNIADMISRMGIKTAILDLTQNRNSYFIYTDNDEALRKKAYTGIQKLVGGECDGIPVNPNLDVYTALPGERNEIDEYKKILKNLLRRYKLILLDCDFNTNYGYIAASTEMYLVQNMDVLTIQPLTAYLKDLQTKKLLDRNKLRIVINKYVRVKGIKEQTIIGGMACYNDPSMSYMSQLFNRETVKYCVVPFDQDAYTKYLAGLFNCKIEAGIYSKEFGQYLRRLANMVYPITGLTPYTGGNPINNTLRKMKGNV